MVDDDRISLGFLGDFVSCLIQRPSHAVDSHSNVIVVIYAGPAEANSFEFFFKLCINIISVSNFTVDKRNSYLSTIIIFPQILSKAFQHLLDILQSAFDSKD